MVELQDRSLAGASPEYREHRKQLLAAETRLREEAEAVAALRRALPEGPVLPRYLLHTGPADLQVTAEPSWLDLPELLASSRDHLVVYHMMFWTTGGCPMCSMWIDGLQGVSAHLLQHVSLAVLAPAP